MNIIDPDTILCPSFVISEQYPAFEGVWHAHKKAQFVYAADGVLTIRTTQGMWLTPPHRAVWIPPNEMHQGCAPRGFRLITLYLDPDMPMVPQRCGVMDVDRLLDALLNEAARFGTHYPPGGPEQRLMEVVLDRLNQQRPLPAFLPAPRDSRLQHLTAVLQANPADDRGLDALAALAGMTGRTAARLFIRETGLTFTQWRQQLRLLKAMQSLSLGASVTNAAGEVGYSDVSTFIQIFKEAFGDTPARYLRSLEQPPHPNTRAGPAIAFT